MGQSGSTPNPPEDGGESSPPFPGGGDNGGGLDGKTPGCTGRPLGHTGSPTHTA